MKGDDFMEKFKVFKIEIEEQKCKAESDMVIYLAECERYLNEQFVKKDGELRWDEVTALRYMAKAFERMVDIADSRKDFLAIKESLKKH